LKGDEGVWEVWEGGMEGREVMGSSSPHGIPGSATAVSH